MKEGSRLFRFGRTGTMHITCTGARKGRTLCGRFVPPARARIGLIHGSAAELERLWKATAKRCSACGRMKDAVG